MMEHSSLAISPHLHISKFSFNVPEPSFERDPTVDESSSSVSVDDEELATAQGPENKVLLGYLKGFVDGDVKQRYDSDPKAAKLLSRLLKLGNQEAEKSHPKGNEILLEYLSRFEENKTDDEAKKEILVTQRAPEELKSVVHKEPEAELEPKEEPAHEPKPQPEPKHTFRPLPPPRELVARGPDRHVWNSLGLNEYAPEPQIQPTSDDTFLESIQSATRSPTVADKAPKFPLSRTTAAADVKYTKSSVADIAGKKGEKKHDYHSKAGKTQKGQHKIDGKRDGVTTEAAGKDGPKDIESERVAAASHPKQGQRDIPEDELDPVDLAQLLGGLHPAMLRSIPGSNDAERNSTDADDADSMNTRNEYWSVSSFRTKTQASDSDENDFSDWLVPPPTDGHSDFTLPLDSLDKPMRKNTYSPVQQRGVEQFLQAAAWHAEPTQEEKETLWGAKKKLPLKPVKEPSRSPVVPASAQPQFSRHRDSHRDLFLQSIQAAERSEQPAAGRERRRDRLERYPGMETVYSEFMREDALTGNRLSVKMISTQTTNPPERVLRSRQQGEPQPTAPVPPPPPPPPPTHKDCVICCEEVHLDDFPKSMHMLGHEICNGCVSNYLTTRIMKEATITIVCPAENCAHALDYNEIKEHAGVKVFDKYDELLSRKAYEEDPNFRWCTNRLCCAGQIVENGDASSHFTCIICQFKTCFQCRTPIHPQMTCMENWTSVRKDYFAADAPSGIWLKSYTKPCYCGRWIQKMDGCDHVKCPRRPIGCGGEWCWMCGASYDDIRRIGNTAHRSDCPHYA